MDDCLRGVINILFIFISLKDVAMFFLNMLQSSWYSFVFQVTNKACLDIYKINSLGTDIFMLTEFM